MCASTRVSYIRVPCTYLRTVVVNCEPGPILLPIGDCARYEALTSLFLHQAFKGSRSLNSFKKPPPTCLNSSENPGSAISFLLLFYFTCFSSSGRGKQGTYDVSFRETPRTVTSQAGGDCRDRSKVTPQYVRQSSPCDCDLLPG